MISKVSPFLAKLRNTFLAMIALSLIGVSVATDFIFRHEIKRQARRELLDNGLQPNINGVIQAVNERKLELFDRYDTAGISFGGIDGTGNSPLSAAIRNGDKDIIEQVLLRQNDLKRTVNVPSKEDGMTPLMLALNQRDFEVAARLIHLLGADVNTESSPGLPYLIQAIRSNDEEMLEFLLGNGVDTNRKGSQPHEALAIAADRDDLPLLKRLVSHGAKIDLKGVTGAPLLLEAAIDSEYEEMQFLLENGADIDVKDNGCQILDLALERQDGQMRAMAVKYGAKLSRIGSSGSPLIVEAVDNGDHDWLLTLLYEGVNIETKSNSGDSLFMMAVKSRDYRLIDFLIDKGININTSDAEGLTPLMLAINEGDTALVRTLIENKAEISPGPMFSAAYQRRDNPTMSLLLSAGVNPEIKLEETDLRVMDVAVNEGAVETVRTLLDAGAQIGDNLWGALLTGQDDLVEVILAKGADPKKRGPKGDDPLEFVLHSERYNLVKPFLDAGADPNPMFDEQESWVSRAVRTANVGTAVALVKAGAELGDGYASDGHSLLGWSIANNNFEVTQALLERDIDPNITERSPARPAFVEKFPESTTFRKALVNDSPIRPLFMAAVKRNHAVAKALVDKGARNHASRKHLYPVAIAAWHSDVKMMQICFGRDPEDNPRKIVINLSSQRVTFYENGVATFSSICSTGKPGYRTPPGTYAITQKNKTHYSSIYGSAMPYFMRLSCRDFGLHVGKCPGYPASAGCIRLPWNAAKHYFAKSSLGDIVVIQP